MESRTQEVLAYLALQRQALEHAVASVPAPLRGRRPTADRWCVAEIVEHLGIVEDSITRLLGAEVAAARKAGLGVELEEGPILPTLPLKRLLDRGSRITTGAAWVPSGAVDSATGWETLVERRRALLELVGSGDGLELSRVVVRHPALGPLNGYQWIAFVGVHEERHTAQIRDVGAALAGADSTARSP
jgi:hypothetical protein